MAQCESAGLACDYLVTATGSGGTLAGLAAGAAMLHDDSTQLIGIQVGKKDPATYGQKIVELANSVLETAGAQE